ncbi:hypothetical protein LX32DRAFT_639202 [Colletotrichum zoysiae]|uniref:Uncharacterized protein n=1 Tax=Colletotrichum zoysiae TaxID=1216348 RepID=A0AAD9HHR1_9PEZI|nr:hypothetical protein LX32DRAFT_639202 [Colletotrichum zoysiae]
MRGPSPSGCLFALSFVQFIYLPVQRKKGKVVPCSKATFESGKRSSCLTGLSQSRDVYMAARPNYASSDKCSIPPSTTSLAPPPRTV